MALSATALRNAKPKDKPYKMADGGGMYLLVKPNGGMYWRLDYRFEGKRKTLALGVYPDVSLKMARDRRHDARQQIADGIDPALAKKAYKKQSAHAAANTFETVAREWHEKKRGAWKESHAETVLLRLEKHVLPWIGNKPIDSLDATHLLPMLRRIEDSGATETAHRMRQICSQVFRYAIATARATRDPAADLKGALKPVKTQHFASITDPDKIGALLRAIDGYTGSFVTKCALQLAPLVFVRPGELRRAEWSEINFDEAEWRIPAEKMKMNAPHIVPLSEQALDIIKELQPLTGRGQYLFPSVRTAKRPMSENTINAALRRLGYAKDEMTGHGFRSMASTILNEQQVWHRDAIERQLAHAERDNVRAAYNYAEHLPERRRMMQAWADYLDSLKSEKVVAFRKATDSVG